MTTIVLVIFVLIYQTLSEKFQITNYNVFRINDMELTTSKFCILCPIF
jgi:hypothetical protein